MSASISLRCHQYAISPQFSIEQVSIFKNNLNLVYTIKDCPHSKSAIQSPLPFQTERNSASLHSPHEVIGNASKIHCSSGKLQGCVINVPEDASGVAEIIGRQNNITYVCVHSVARCHSTDVIGIYQVVGDDWQLLFKRFMKTTTEYRLELVTTTKQPVIMQLTPNDVRFINLQGSEEWGWDFDGAVHVSQTLVDEERQIIWLKQKHCWTAATFLGRIVLQLHIPAKAYASFICSQNLVLFNAFESVIEICPFDRLFIPALEIAQSQDPVIIVEPKAEN